MANITVDKLQGLIFYILYCLYLSYMFKKKHYVRGHLTLFDTEMLFV